MWGKEASGVYWGSYAVGESVSQCRASNCSYMQTQISWGTELIPGYVFRASSCWCICGYVCIWV